MKHHQCSKLSLGVFHEFMKNGLIACITVVYQQIQVIILLQQGGPQMGMLQ